MSIQVCTGDVFCAASPWMIGRAILFAERLWSHDNEALFSHAGIIDSADGCTFEALWRVRHAHLNEYAGKPIIIARPRVAMSRIEERLTPFKQQFEGKFYPLHRLVMHMLPPLAKLGTGDFVVCSELVAAYLWALGLRYKQYLGTNPDTLADEWLAGYCCDVVFEGIWQSGDKKQMTEGK